MPKQYEAIRDSKSLKSKYPSLKERKSHAARIYNSLRKEHPSLAPLNPRRRGK